MWVFHSLSSSFQFPVGALGEVGGSLFCYDPIAKLFLWFFSHSLDLLLHCRMWRMSSDVCLKPLVRSEVLHFLLSFIV